MEESSNMHQMTNATSASAVSGVDLISDLQDDLLLRILSFLPAASEVARTSVLSRRWRHLWPNAIALRFTLGGSKPETYTEADGDEARRLIAAASAVVAQRADNGPDVEDLDLDFIYESDDNQNQFDRGLHYHAKDITSEHIAAWLLFAERRVTGRFMLAVPHHVDEEEDDDDDGADDDEQEAQEEIQEEEEEEHVAEPEVEVDADGVAAAVEVEALAALVMEDVQEPVVEHDDDEDNGEEKGEKVAEEIQEEEEHVAEVEVEAEAAAEAVEMVEPVVELEHADDDNKDEKDMAILVAKLPCSARLQDLRLTLGEARLMVPIASTGALDALTDIFLSYARVDSAAGDDVRLSGLLSSSCSPRLRRLRLYYVPGLATLSINAADTLEELRLTSLCDLTSLDVAAPGLRELGVWACRQLSEARISAPRVQELEFVRHTKLLHFDGAASVRHIETLPMWSHRKRCRHVENDEDDYNNNSAAMWLLQNCTGVDRLGLEAMMPIWWSHIMEAHSDDIQEGDIVDMMAEVPHLPNIIDLTIDVHAYGHAIGASLAKLIAKCTNIQHLSICMYSTGKECLDLSCICHHQSTDWDCSQKLSLEHLRSIEIIDMELLDSQIRLVRLLLASATALERMTVELDTSHLEDGEEVDFGDIPCYGGRWLPSVWECSELGLFVRPVEYEWIQDMERVQGTGEA